MGVKATKEELDKRKDCTSATFSTSSNCMNTKKQPLNVEPHQFSIQDMESEGSESELEPLTKLNESEGEPEDSQTESDEEPELPSLPRPSLRQPETLLRPESSATFKTYSNCISMNTKKQPCNVEPHQYGIKFMPKVPFFFQSDGDEVLEMLSDEEDTDSLIDKEFEIDETEKSTPSTRPKREIKPLDMLSDEEDTPSTPPKREIKPALSIRK